MDSTPDLTHEIVDGMRRWLGLVIAFRKQDEESFKALLNQPDDEPSEVLAGFMNLTMYILTDVYANEIALDHAPNCDCDLPDFWEWSEDYLERLALHLAGIETVPSQ